MICNFWPLDFQVYHLLANLFVRSRRSKGTMYDRLLPSCSKDTDLRNLRLCAFRKNKFLLMPFFRRGARVQRVPNIVVFVFSPWHVADDDSSRHQGQQSCFVRSSHPSELMRQVLWLHQPLQKEGRSPRRMEKWPNWPQNNFHDSSHHADNGMAWDTQAL